MLLLDRRAFYRTERAEHTAVARLGTQQRFAVTALVVKLTGVHGHGFLFLETAMRASQYGLKNNGAHGGIVSEFVKNRMLIRRYCIT